MRYCTNPDTGLVQQQDQEDFSLPLDPRRAPFDLLESDRLRTPRTELQQQVEFRCFRYKHVPPGCPGTTEPEKQQGKTAAGKTQQEQEHSLLMS